MGVHQDNARGGNAAQRVKAMKSPIAAGGRFGHSQGLRAV